MSKYKSKILVWNLGTHIDQGPDQIISRDMLPEELAASKCIAFSNPQTGHIYISSNCKYREFIWAHERGHQEIRIVQRKANGGKEPACNPILDEMQADLFAASLYGTNYTIQALEWVRDNLFDKPSPGFLKLMEVRMRFIRGLNPLMLESIKAVE